MGMFDCPKHGLRGLLEMCEHVYASLQTSNPIDAKRSISLLLCPVCYERASMHQFDGVKLEEKNEAIVEAYSEAYGQISRVVCCSECVQEAEYYAAKRAGRPLPFIGYERTLNWSQLEAVDQLEAALQERFVFQPSRRPVSKGRSSLFVMPGSFTEPLTIEIYYVTAPSEQAQILTLIAEFFVASDYPQRRILFYEAERWHEETRGNSSSYQCLEGVLLREELVA